MDGKRGVHHFFGKSWEPADAAVTLLLLLMFLGLVCAFLSLLAQKGMPAA